MNVVIMTLHRSPFNDEGAKMLKNLTLLSASAYRKALPCVLVASISLVLAGCSSSSSSDSGFSDSESSDEITEAETGTIAEELLDDLEFGTLLGGLQRAGLQEALNTDNDGLGWTVFAPADTMFEMDPDFQDLPTILEQTEIIRGHVASGTILFTDLVPGTSITMQDGNEALISLAADGASIVVGGATIITQGRIVSNGVIHRVDSLVTTE